MGVVIYPLWCCLLCDESEKSKKQLGLSKARLTYQSSGLTRLAADFIVNARFQTVILNLEGHL